MRVGCTWNFTNGIAQGLDKNTIHNRNLTFTWICSEMGASYFNGVAPSLYRSLDTVPLRYLKVQRDAQLTGRGDGGVSGGWIPELDGYLLITSVPGVSKIAGGVGVWNNSFTDSGWLYN